MTAYLSGNTLFILQLNRPFHYPPTVDVGGSSYSCAQRTAGLTPWQCRNCGYCQARKLSERGIAVALSYSGSHRDQIL